MILRFACAEGGGGLVEAGAYATRPRAVGDLRGDGAADLAIGAWPVRN